MRIVGKIFLLGEVLAAGKVCQRQLLLSVCGFVINPLEILKVGVVLLEISVPCATLNVEVFKKGVNPLLVLVYVWSVVKNSLIGPHIDHSHCVGTTS